MFALLKGVLPTAASWQLARQCQLESTRRLISKSLESPRAASCCHCRPSSVFYRRLPSLLYSSGIDTNLVDFWECRCSVCGWIAAVRESRTLCSPGWWFPSWCWRSGRSPDSRNPGTARICEWNHPTSLVIWPPRVSRSRWNDHFWSRLASGPRVRSRNIWSDLQHAKATRFSIRRVPVHVLGC